MHWDIGVRVKNIYPRGLGRKITSGFWNGYTRCSRAFGWLIWGWKTCSLSFALSRSQLAGSVCGDFTHCLKYSATLDRLAKAGSNLDRISSLESDVLSINASLHIFQDH